MINYEFLNRAVWRLLNSSTGITNYLQSSWNQSNMKRVVITETHRGTLQSDCPHWSLWCIRSVLLPLNWSQGREWTWSHLTSALAAKALIHTKEENQGEALAALPASTIMSHGWLDALFWWRLWHWHMSNLAAYIVWLYCYCHKITLHSLTSQKIKQ